MVWFLKLSRDFFTDLGMQKFPERLNVKSQLLGSFVEVLVPFRL